MSRRKSDKQVAREIKSMSRDVFSFISSHSTQAELEAEERGHADPTPPHIRKFTRKRQPVRDNPSWVKQGERLKPLPGGNSVGRPPTERQESVAQMVALYTAMGISQEAIAQRFGMGRNTLSKLYRPELCHGREINEMFWIGSLANAARKGKVDAIKFALERKFGWIEKSQVTINDGESGIIFSGDRPPARDITDAAFEEVGPTNAAPVRDTDDEDAV